MNILVVDDDQEWRTTIIRFIRRKMGDYLSSLWFYEAGSMQEAILALDSNTKFDVTLLDLNLPDSSKEETLSRIPDFPPPVIVTSAYDDEATRELAFASGAQGFFGKGNILRLCVKIADVRLHDLQKAIKSG